jgi:biopolymer transport protein TolQ
MQTILLPSIFSGSVWQIVGNTSTFGMLILIMLLAMSLVSWVIIFYKWRLYRSVTRASQAFLGTFRRARQMADALGPAKANAASPLSQVFLAGFAELSELVHFRNQGGALQAQANPLTAEDYELVEMAMEKTTTEAIGGLEKMTIFLATTGNSAPFMGLLGTVVGIMDSFWAIGERGSASLAVVAPGIAEALLATIVGLGAAIPAVIAYNWANNKTRFAHDAARSFILEFIARAKKEAR